MGTKLCDGKINPIWVKIEGRTASGYWGFSPPPIPEGTKRIRITCPKCKRRIISSITINYDGDYIIHSLPSHNPKGWWKRHNKRKEKSRQIRPK